MLKSSILAMMLILLLGCGGGDNGTQPNRKSPETVIVDNDVYDPDNYMSVLLSIHENMYGYANIGLLIMSDIGVSGKTSAVWKAILNTYHSNIPLAITKRQEGAVFKVKATEHISDYIDWNDSMTEDALTALDRVLNNAGDKKVTYTTGGKLRVIRDYISTPKRYELFKSKVKLLIIGMGNDAWDIHSSRDHNLACTDSAYQATLTVYQKLHGIIPFGVVKDHRGHNNRFLDIFKTVDIPVMKYIYGVNTYGTYGDHGGGDTEVILAVSRPNSFKRYPCTITLKDKTLKITSFDGNDVCIENDGTLPVMGFLKEVVTNLNSLITK